MSSGSPSSPPHATPRSSPMPRRPRAVAPTPNSVRAPGESPFSPPHPWPHRPSSSPDGQVTPSVVATTSVNIAELKRKSVPELQEMAEGYAVENPGGLRKQDLI